MNTSKQPYVGPRTYTREESDIFFGRDRDARQLTSLVISQPLVLFYAQSGAGKSSLINAQLIPRLEHQGYEVLLPVGRVGGDPPSDLDVDNIFVFNLLRSLDQDVMNLPKFAKLSLADFLADLVVDGERCHYRPLQANEQGAGAAMLENVSTFTEPMPRALIIDQFEEILTTNLHAWEQRKEFFQQLSEALAQDPFLAVVLSIREDYVAGLDPYAHVLPGNLRDRFYMQRMGYDAALDAVRLPVQSLRPFAAGVAESLVDNLRQVKIQGVEGEEELVIGQFVEPVQLQVVCLQLWETLRNKPGEQITEPDLLDVAGGQGLVEFVNSALSSFYEQAIALVLQDPKLDVNERDLRQWFSTRLITESHTRGLVYRGDTHTGGAADKGGLPNEAVDLMQERYLIRAETRAGGTWYELVHDRFIGPILSANQAWQVKRMQSSSLTRAANDWDKSGRAENKLYIGTLLDRAQERVKIDPAGQDDLVQQFLQASQERQKSLELAEAQKEARQAKILRRLAEGLVVAVVIAVIFGIAAFIQAGNAEQEAIAAGHSAATATAAVATAVVDRDIAVDAQATATVAMATAIVDRDSARKALATAVMAQSTAVVAQSTAVAAQSDAVAAQIQAETARNETESLRLAALARDQIGSTLQGALLLGVEASKSMMTQEARNALLLALDIKANYQPGKDPPESAAIRQSFMMHDSPITASAVSSDGSSLATASSSSVIIWTNLTAGVPVSRTFLPLDGPTVVQMAFTHTGSDLTLFYADGTLSVDSVDNGQRELLALDGLNKNTGISALSADGSILAIANCAGVGSDKSCVQGQVTLLDLTAQHPISESKKLREIAGNVTTLSFDLDGHVLAVGSENGDVSLWRLSVDGETFQINPWIDNYRIDRIDTHPVLAMAFNPTDTTLALATDAGGVTLWRIGEERLIKTHTLDQFHVRHIAFNSTGTLFATADVHGDIVLWDSSTGQPIGEEMAGHLFTNTEEPVNTAFFLPNSDLLVTTGYDQRAILWQMDSNEWPQFACELAGRNLENNEWVQAFGDRFYAPTCDAYPVHSTVIQAKIKRGRELARRCSRADSEEAMSLLDFADDLDVNQSLNPATIMVQVLKETARVYLRQEDDDAASDCLEEANRIVDTERLNGELRVDVTAVVNSGLEMTRLLDGIQGFIKNDEYDQALAQVEVALDYDKLISEEVDPGLLEAYYQICTGGAESGPTGTSETACQRVVELAPRLTFGESVFGDVADGNVWAFAGQAGQSVRIAMGEDGSGVDTMVSLIQADGLLLKYDDDGGDGWNSLISEYSLPETGIYIIGSDAYESSGAFVLSLDLLEMASIAYDEVRLGTIENNILWTLTGESGQIIQVFLRGEGSRIHPRIEVRDPDGNSLASDDNYDQTNDARIYSLILPQDGDYRIIPSANEDKGAYALEVKQIEPQLIEFGNSKNSTVDEVPLWAFAGQEGQMVRIRLSDDNSNIDPYVELLDREGNRLVMGNYSGNGSLIGGYSLPETGDYLIRPSDLNGATNPAYLLSLETIEPQTIGVGDTVGGRIEDGAVWQIVVDTGQLVNIALKDDGSRIDSTLVIRDDKGNQIAYDDDSGEGYDSLIPRYWLLADTPYLIIPGAYGSSGSYLLSVEAVLPQPIMFGEVAFGEIADYTAWQFLGEAGQIVRISVAEDKSDIDTQFEVRDPAGNRLAGDDDGGEEQNSLLPALLLPSTGLYTVLPSAYTSSGTYLLTVSEGSMPESESERRLLLEPVLNTSEELVRQGNMDKALDHLELIAAQYPELGLDPSAIIQRTRANWLVDQAETSLMDNPQTLINSQLQEAMGLATDLGDAGLLLRICRLESYDSLVETVAPACQQVVASAPKIAPGETVTGMINSGLVDLWQLVDASDREIVIIMESDDSALDTVLRLDAGTAMGEIDFSDDYSGSNSQIGPMWLTAEGPFLIEAGGYSSSSGAYRLRVIDMNSSEGTAAQAEILIAEAENLVSNGFGAEDYTTALERLNQALSVAPEMAEAIQTVRAITLLFLAVDALESDEPAAAVSWFAQGHEVVEDTGSHDLSVLLCVVGHELGNDPLPEMLPECQQSLSGADVITPGEVVTGTLTTSGDDFVSLLGSYQAWRFDGETGDVITLNVRGEDPDLTFSMHLLGGEDLIKLDYDFINSQIGPLTSTQGGPYLVLVGTYDTGGIYELELTVE